MTPQRRRLVEATMEWHAARAKRRLWDIAPGAELSPAAALYAAEAAYDKHLSDIRHHTSRRTRARRHA